MYTLRTRKLTSLHKAANTGPHHFPKRFLPGQARSVRQEPAVSTCLGSYSHQSARRPPSLLTSRPHRRAACPQRVDGRRARVMGAIKLPARKQTVAQSAGRAVPRMPPVRAAVMLGAAAAPAAHVQKRRLAKRKKRPTPWAVGDEDGTRAGEAHAQGKAGSAVARLPRARVPHRKLRT